jgi:hypothetical protein
MNQRYCRSLSRTKLQAICTVPSGSARATTLLPVHGKFLLMRQSAFGITHDNVPANYMI